MTLEDWFSKWWQDLPKHHFTSQNKGSRAECLKEVQKLNPDEELRDHIDWFTRERALRCAKMKSKDIKIAGWKHAVRLIKYRFWDDDLESISTEREKVASSKCSCGADTVIVNRCGKCHDAQSADNKTRQALIRDNLKSIGMDKHGDETNQEYFARCREHTVPRLARLRAQRGMAGNGR